MKVSKGWLHELFDLNISDEKLESLLPLRTIGTKEITEDFIELDMKGYNRADLLSLRGVALEVAAITDSKILFENDSNTLQLAQIKPSNKKLNVVVETPDLCPLYCVAKIEGLKVSKSKDEWIKKLESSGIRSVNNLTDITNLLMLEFGQPMHAFDATEIKNEEIIVRLAKDGERLRTLDDKDRILDKNDILITDSEKVLGLAGLMGGKNSEIKDSTTTILLEAAIFNPQTIRSSATRLGLVTEAGKRFYHGLTKERLIQAINKAFELYSELGGEITGFEMIDNYKEKNIQINLSQEKVNSLIGVEVSDKDIENYLNKLNFKLEKNAQGWLVTPPYWRLDITIEEDLIEEIARLYGYEKIPSIELSKQIPTKEGQQFFDLINNLKKTLAKEGLTEVQTYSFYSSAILENIGWSPNNLESLVKIANPISSETQYLRHVIWQNLLEVIAKNIKQGFSDIAVFEIGKMYGAKKGEKPQEGYDLAFAIMNGSNNPIQELYSILQRATQKLGIKVELGDNERGEIEEMLFHPVRFKHLIINNQINGGIAEVHPRILNKFGISQRVAIIEISIEKLFLKR